MTAQAMDNGRPLDNNDEAMTLTEHLGELRRRILHSLAALAAGTLVSSFYIDEIVAVLTAPATNLYYMRPAEAFFIYIKIALACGVLLAAPVLFYELWAFLVPALTGRERSALMLVVPFGFIFNLPMVLIVLAQMGVVSSAVLKRGRRYMVVASFILAAVITPTPDVVTQTLLAVPMILLYEGSRIFIKLVLRK